MYLGDEGTNATERGYKRASKLLCPFGVRHERVHLVIPFANIAMSFNGAVLNAQRRAMVIL